MICQFARQCSLERCYHKKRHDLCIYPYHSCNIKQRMYDIGELSNHIYKCIKVKHIQQ